MLKPVSATSVAIDLKNAGDRCMISCEHGDYGRLAARLHSGEWTDAVLTVYGSINAGKTIHATGETLTASTRATDTLDVIGWTSLVVVVTTPDTGSGGEALVDSMFKGPA